MVEFQFIKDFSSKEYWLPFHLFSEGQYKLFDPDFGFNPISYIPKSLMDDNKVIKTICKYD